MLIRAHGGVFPTYSCTCYIAVSEKKSTNSESKRLIGKEAVTFIEEKDPIILDSGITTFETS